MKTLTRLLQNRNVIFLLALTLGLTLPHATPVSRHLLLPALALAMTLSTLEIGGEFFRSPKTLLLPALLGIFMSYVVLGNLIIGLSALLIPNEALWTGFVLLAAAPPAIAVIPFSVFLNASRPLSLVATMGAYLGALFIMPLIAMGLLSIEAFDPFKLLMIMMELIILPLALSRLLIQKGWKERFDPYLGLITNWCFFVALYTLVGLNRTLIFEQTDLLLPVLFIAFISMFFLGFLIHWVASLLRLPSETRMSLVLLETLKNQGISGGLALTLFAKEAALPSAISTIMMIAFVLWLGMKKGWK